jgi:DNA polymerase V
MDEDARVSRREQAILEIKGRYGKNAILRGLNFEEGATQRDRNAQVGGHKE